MNFSELCGEAFSPEIYEIWTKQGIETALPVQEAAVKAGLLSGMSQLIVAPTSSGKTFLGEMLAFNRALNGHRAIYLVPFKAIAEERHSEFVTRYRDNPRLGFRCIVSDRDHHESDADLLKGKFDVAILTYEKLTALLVANKGILAACGCVIIDEIQLLTDPNRGPRLELLLTRLRSMGSTCQLLGLSAVLGRLNGFDEWLGAKVIREDRRPVELRMGVLDADGMFGYVEANSRATGREQFKSGRLDLVVSEITGRGEQILIFVSTVKRTGEVAELLSKALHLPAASGALKQLSDEADTETRDLLMKTLRNGVALHNADCELPERLIVEDAFRRREVKVLVSTTTLSMGVNLPADVVILADATKWNQVAGSWTQVPWRPAEVRNILGRAGRLGKTSTYGRGFLLASTRVEAMQHQRRYLETEIEPLSSALADADVDGRVLSVVATGYASTATEVEQFLFDTFAGKGWANVRPQVHKLISEGIERCRKLELFSADTGDSLKVTKLGAICAANQLSLSTFADLVAYVGEVRAFDALDASFAAARAAEVKAAVARINWDDAERNLVVRTDLNKSYSENRLVGLIHKVLSFLARKPSSEHNAELTMASVCRAVLESDRPMSEIRSAFRISAAHIRQMGENVAWIIEVMGAIAAVQRPELRVQFEELAGCLKRRAPFSCRHLNDMPPYVTRDERLKLRARGIEKTEQFLELVPSSLTGIMSPTKAERIMRDLGDERQRSYGYWERDHRRRLDRLRSSTDLVDRLYTAKDKDLELAVEALFNTGFAKCHAQRIAEQRSGEPDLLLFFESGKKVSVQITAKESNAKFVDSKKAGDVVPQSARFHVDGFMCLGRPDFEALAREQAGHLAAKYNYKQLPVYVVAELFVLVTEKRIEPSVAEDFVLNQRGYLTLAQVPGYVSTSR